MPDTTDPLEAAAMSLLLTEPDPKPETEDAQPAAAASDDTEGPDTATEAEANDQTAPDDTTADDDADAEGPRDEAADLHEYKVNGQVRRATLQELKQRAALADGAEHRFQEAAAMRKQAEAVATALQSEMQRVQALRQQFETKGFLPRPTPPDPSLAESDPVGYVKATAAFQAKAQAWQAQQAQLRQVEEQQARAMSAAQDAYLRQQAAALAERIPDFAKPETAAKQRERLTRAAEAYGYTASEIDALTDARAVQVLHDAAMWREMQAAKAQAQAQRQPEAPKHIPNKPRRPEPPQLARARKIEQARKSKSVDSWAALLLE